MQSSIEQLREINYMNNNYSVRLNKIKLNARRGNLEVDLLLASYISQSLASESNQTIWQQFETLLEMDDQTLFHWLMNPNSADHSYTELIQSIRKNYLISTS